MTAIRLARGATNRSVVVKFAGCYHGHVDALLAAAGSGVATFGLPDSAGVPASAAGETLVLPYNDVAALEAAFAARGEEIACVITEASPGNMGVVPPLPGFTEALRRVSRAHGALLISDEVMTGFRCSRSGWYGLEGPYDGGAPDLFTFGKVMGGGFPAAAFGGRRDLMSLLSPAGPVYQAGTLSGNPVATAAGLATLRGCTDEVYGPARRRVAGDRRRRVRRARRRGGPAPRAVGRLDVQRLLPRGPGDLVRRCEGAGHGGLPRLLPRHAQPGRAPAAERLRGVVRQRRPRRRGGRARARRPARGGRARPRRRAAREHPHRRPPAPARRGRQPEGRALRPASRLPPQRARPADGAGRRRPPRRARRHRPDRVPARARAGRRRRRLAEALHLPVGSDPRLIEAGNWFEGKQFGVGAGSLARPGTWPRLVNPFKPSWGEPYEEIAERMLAAVADAREAARGHEAVLVSHQLPVWTARRRVEGKHLWHDPRSRECTLASLTSLEYADDELRSVTYSEPAAALAAARLVDGGRMTGLLGVRTTRRGLGALVAGALALGLSACTDDPNSVAAQAKAGDNKGFVAGDGSVEQLTAGQRGPAVQLSGTTVTGGSWSMAKEGAGKVVVVNVWAPGADRAPRSCRTCSRRGRPTRRRARTSTSSASTPASRRPPGRRTCSGSA